MNRIRSGVKQGTATAAALLALTVLGGCSGPPAAPESEREKSAGSGPPVVLPGGPGDEPRVVDAAKGAQLVEQQKPGKSSVHYVRMMIPHHQQALAMTALAPERAKHPKVRALADRIGDAQGAEIGMMQGWLKRNGFEPVPENKAEQLGDEHRRMMGMATREEMRQLREASGTEFDRLFLKLMSTHHQGAVDMAVKLLARGVAPQVRSMAKDAMASQRDEVATMQRLLDEIG